VKCGLSSSPSGYADIAQEESHVLFHMYWLVLTFLTSPFVSLPPFFFSCAPVLTDLGALS